MSTHTHTHTHRSPLLTLQKHPRLRPALTHINITQQPALKHKLTQTTQRQKEEIKTEQSSVKVGGVWVGGV